MRKLLFATFFLFLTSLPWSLFAFTGLSSESVVFSLPVADDLYLAGKQVIVESPISWDLNIVGADILSSASVTQWILAAGANVRLSGTVGNNIRVVGANITIDNQIGGDLVAAGGNIMIEPGTTIGRDLVVAGANVTLNGTVKGNIRIEAEQLTLMGHVIGNAHIDANNIIVGTNAKIDGKLEYASKVAQLKLESITQGTKKFTLLKQWKLNLRGILPFLAIYLFSKFLFLVLFSLLILAFMGRYVRETSDILQVHPFKSFFTGFAFFFLLPIVGIFLAITIIALPFAILSFVLFGLMFLFYELLGTVILSSWILHRFFENRNHVWWIRLLVVLGVALFFALISGVDLFVAWAAIGALLLRHAKLIQSIR